MDDQKEKIADVQDELERRVLLLSTLSEMSQLLHSSLKLSSIINHLLLSPMGRLMVNKGVFLLQHPDHQFEVQTLKGLDRKLIGKRVRILDVLERPFLKEELTQESPELCQLMDAFQLSLGVPILLRNELIGLLCFGHKLTNKPYTEEELEFMSSLANMAATSIENAKVFEELKQVNLKLDKKVQELNTLFDTAKALNATLESDKIIKVFTYALMGEMLVSKFVILLKRDDEIIEADRKGFKEVELDDKIRHLLFNVANATGAANLENDELRAALTEMEIYGIVPMRSQDVTKGMLLLGEKMIIKEFAEDELSYMQTMGNQVITSLENAWLFEDSLERKRLEEELTIARGIQAGLLPKEFPQVPNFDIYGLNIPSKHVGGDYFDVIEIDDRYHLITIADVSGKGVGASILMSNLQASLHVLTSEVHNICELVSRINNIIFKNTGMDKFITFFIGVIDKQENTFVYVNAGHNPPYLTHKDGTLEMLETGGPILGFMPDCEYQKGKIKLNSGDGIVMFTDGVTEAVRPDGEQYEEHRLEKLLAAESDKSAREITDSVIAAIREFSNNDLSADDVTMVVVKAQK